MVATRKSYAWLALQAWLLLGAAATFAVSVQSVALPVVTGLLLTVSFIKRMPLPHTVRAWVWSLVGCAGFCLLLASPEPSDTVRFTLMASHRFCPILLGIGIAMTFFEQRAASLGAQATCALIAVILAGGNDAEGIDQEAIRRVQACLMAAMLLPFWILVRRAAAGVPVLPSGRVRRRFLSGRAPGMAMAFLLAAGLFAFVQLRVFGWSDAWGNFLSEWAQSAASRRAGRQLPIADVRHPPPAAGKGRDAVVLRVWAEREPGYLRAVAYPIYGRGVWRALRAVRPMTEVDTPIEVAPAQRFARPDWTAPANGAAWSAWRVQPTGAFGGAYLPLPGVAEQVEIVADNALCDRDGSVRVEAWVRSSGYRVHLPSPRGAAYARQLARTGDDEGADGKDPYLAVPLSVATGLQQRLAEWQIPAPDAPARARINAVRCALLTNHTYRLGVKLRPDCDPVLQFLEHREGHCELFASATALLLRQCGVRARYVTGFVCNEPHPSRHYWVSRTSTAHAWVEAYVPETAQWEVVEATPPDGQPSGVSRFGRWERHWDPLLAALRQAWGALRSGAAVQGLRMGVARGVIWLIDHALTALVPVVVLGGAWLAWRATRDRRTTPAQRRRLNALRRQIDRRLAAAGRPRPPHCTLREGVMQAASLEPDECQSLMELVAAWERERYG